MILGTKSRSTTYCYSLLIDISLAIQLKFTQLKFPMIKNYSQRLEKLKKRRSDDLLQKSFVSESFYKTEFSESVKYALESMREIDSNYTQNTYLASEKVRANLTKGYESKGLSVTYKHQGSVETNTTIKLHSDIDILAITGKYNSLEHPLVPSSPYQGNPLNDLKELRNESYNILNSVYKQVDDSKSKAIQVFPTDPKRKVDVVIANWYHSVEYNNNGSHEKYRGVQIYDKNNHSRKEDFPFLHISKINEKGSITNDGLKKIIRLLKTLKIDADYSIDLSSFEITSIVYNMSISSLLKSQNQSLLLLPETSTQLDKIINDKPYRESLLSPNGKELVFGTDASKIVEIKKLKLELDELIQDINEELGKAYKKIDNQIIYS